MAGCNARPFFGSSRVMSVKQPFYMPSRDVGRSRQVAMVGPLNMVEAYNRWLLKHPITSNFVSGSLIVVLGDILSQGFEYFRKYPSPEDRPAFTFHKKRLIDAGT